MTAQQTHQFMIDSRQAAEDRRLIQCAENILRDSTFDAATLDAIRYERGMRAERLERFVERHGYRAIAF